MRAPLYMLPLLVGCLMEVPAGPDLGACAEPPEGVYTYGQIGIGSCIAAPTGLDFMVSEGRTWLMVANANIHANFERGSLLMIDWASVPRTAAAPRRIRVDTLDTRSVPLDSYLGQIARLDAPRRAFIPSRFSVDSLITAADDRVWAVDLANADAPVPFPGRRAITVRQDPYAAAADRSTGRVFVVNGTGGSVSVLDGASSPPDHIDPAPASVLTVAPFDRVPGSELVAELRVRPAEGTRVSTTDTWRLSYVDGTARAWIRDPDGALRRWSSGGADFVPSGFGTEIDPELVPGMSEVVDPWLVLLPDALAMFLSDGEGGIRSAVTDGSAGVWSVDASPLLRGRSGSWDAWLEGPAGIEISDRTLLYYTGRSGPDALDGVLGLAVATSGEGYVPLADPIIAPPEGVLHLTHPTPMVDPRTQAVRLWASQWDGRRWTIGHAFSDGDGRRFEPLQTVFDDPLYDVAAPVVIHTPGAYRMWLSVHDGDTWWLARSQSVDGIDWSPPEPLLDLGTSDLLQPPRAAIQDATDGRWRIRGVSSGQVDEGVTPGASFATSTHGFRVDLAVGHMVGVEGSTRASLGVTPRSYVSAPIPTLYATLRDDTVTDRVGALRLVGGRWAFASTDLIPEGTGDNGGGVRSPLVWREGDAFHMLYAARRPGDVWRVRLAVSDDGLSFTPVEEAPLPEPEGWAAVEQLPGSIEVLDDGRRRLWFSGSDGSRFRIGSATSTDGRTFTVDPGGTRPWVLGAGLPGTHDDAGVRDPAVVRYTRPTADGTEDVRELWYSGFDGDRWSIASARSVNDGPWDRVQAPLLNRPGPALTAIERTFAHRGVRSPVMVADANMDPLLRARLPAPEGGWRMFFAGGADDAWRTGSARVTHRGVFPELGLPSPGDAGGFQTGRGQPGRSEIELNQVVDNQNTLSGRFREGEVLAAAIAIDEARGFAFVPFKVDDQVVVIDTRDDSTPDFDDRNHLDIEAVIRVDASARIPGYEGAAFHPDGRLFLASRNPEGIVVIDTSSITDEDRKRRVHRVTQAVLPLPRARRSQSFLFFDNSVPIGPIGLAIVQDQDLLLVSHFRDAAVAIIDISGDQPELIRYIRGVGENPGPIAVSPDNNWAVVGNITGSTRQDVVDSSLAVIDLRPESPRYLEVTSWIANR